jgi:hypothetical protein
MDKTTNYCNHGGWFTMSKGHWLEKKRTCESIKNGFNKLNGKHIPKSNNFWCNLLIM